MAAVATSAKDAPSAGRLRSAQRRDLIGIYILAVIVNGLAGSFISKPGYVDAYYYFGSALQLARGHGFTEPYLWNYLGPHQLPAAAEPRWPSHLYWMPLTAMAAAGGLAAAELATGRTLATSELFRAAQVPMVALASLVPLLSYVYARHLNGARRHALAAALLTLFSPFYFSYWSNTDAFAVFALAAAAALMAAALANGRRGWCLAAGLGAGLAQLARADGALVFLIVAIWLLASVRPRRAGIMSSLLALTGYALVMGPWFLRNWLVVGQPLASGGTQTLWLVEYNELFNYTASTLNPQHYLAQGLAVIGRAKLAALMTNLMALLAVQGGVVVLPFALVGLWRMRRLPLVQLGTLYAGALLVTMSLIFTWPGVRGGFFHSGAALLPLLCGSAGVGLDGVVEAAARRRPHWRPEISKPIFAGLLVALSVVMAAGLFGVRVVGPDWRQPRWGQADTGYDAAGAWLRDNSAGATLTATNNPPGWYYATGQPSIVIPNGDAAQLVQALDEHHAGWVLLDANFPAGLAGLYAQPESEPRLALRASFGSAGGSAAYLLERTAVP